MLTSLELSNVDNLSQSMLPEQRRDGDGKRLIRSEDLFNGQSEIRIDHHGEIYRMRITKAGKLILNK